MEGTEVVEPKRRGRPKGSKTSGAKRTRTTRNVMVCLPEQASKYLTYYHEKTGASFNRLMNICVEHARVEDILKGTPREEPAKVRNARAAIEEWEIATKQRKH